MHNLAQRRQCQVFDLQNDSKLITHPFVWSIVSYVKRYHSTTSNIQPGRWHQDCVHKLAMHYHVQGIADYAKCQSSGRQSMMVDINH